MTKQEFKTAFKLLTGKDIGHRTIIDCKDGIITQIFEFKDVGSRIGFLSNDINKFIKQAVREISYEDILNMMKK